MRSHATTAADDFAGRRSPPERDSSAALQHELAQSRSACQRQAKAIDGLTRALGVLRRGANALADENRELRAEIDNLRRAN
jgi:hypothetical protein